MVKDYSISLQEQFQTDKLEAVMGGMPDYVDLAFTHFDKTGIRLFGEKYNYNYARTQTKIESSVAVVGDFDSDDGLSVSHWNPGHSNSSLDASPLVVPSGNR